MGFKKVDVKTLEMKPFEKIGSEWMLILNFYCTVF